jgi:single-strand DNA-binding protein
MAGSVNKVILVGNLGRDPEVRHTQDGRPIVNLSLANLAKVAEQYLKKGSTVYIEGQLQTRKYTDKDGAEKYSTEVVLQNFRGELTMLGGRPGSGDTAGSSGGDDFGASSPMERPRAGGGAKPSFSRELDDEVPF